MKKKRTLHQNKDELIDVGSNNQILQANNILNNDYTKSVILEGELSLAEMQVAAGKNKNGKQRSAFKNFQNNLKIICEQQ